MIKKDVSSDTPVRVDYSLFVFNKNVTILANTDFGGINLNGVIRNGEERARKALAKNGTVKNGGYPLSKSLAASVSKERVQSYIQKEYLLLKKRKGVVKDAFNLMDSILEGQCRDNEREGF